jgi:hypothetical protein
MALHFDYASTRSPTASKRPTPTATRGSLYTAPLSLRFLYSFDAAVQRLTAGLPLCSTNTGAYCKARKRLAVDMLPTLVRHTGSLIAAQTPKTWLWYGRRVRLVDGTTVTLLDTAANQVTYSQQSGQKPGLGFPICRIVAVTCLSTGAVLNAAMGNVKGKGGCEQALFRTLLDTFGAGDIMLGGAFYATYFLLAQLQSRKVDAFFEKHGSRKRDCERIQAVFLV